MATEVSLSRMHRFWKTESPYLRLDLPCSAPVYHMSYSALFSGVLPETRVYICYEHMPMKFSTSSRIWQIFLSSAKPVHFHWHTFYTFIEAKYINFCIWRRTNSCSQSYVPVKKDIPFGIVSFVSIYFRNLFRPLRNFPLSCLWLGKTLATLKLAYFTWQYSKNFKYITLIKHKTRNCAISFRHPISHHLMAISCL